MNCNWCADKHMVWRWYFIIFIYSIIDKTRHTTSHTTSLVLYPAWCTLLSNQQTVWDLAHGLWNCGYLAHQHYLSCSLSQSRARGQQGLSVWMAWLALLHCGREHLAATDRLWLRLYKQSSVIGGAVILRGSPKARTQALNQLVCVYVCKHPCECVEEWEYSSL